MLSLLSKLGLKFKDPILESSYIAFQDEKSKKLFSTSSFIFSGLLIVTALLELNHGSLVHGVIKGALSLAALVVLILKKKMHFVYNLFFALTPLCFLLYYMYCFRDFFYQESPDGYFLAGNLFGIFEVLFILGFRRMQVKIAIIVIIGGFEFAVIRNQMIPESITLIIGVCILLLIFVVIQDVFARQDYAEHYKKHNNLTRLQDYLTKELQLGVLIVSSDLKDFVFSNNCFQQTFGQFDQAKQNYISLFVRNFVIETSTTSSSSPVSSDPKTLRDFLYNLPDDLIFDANGSRVFIVSTTYQTSEQTLLRYEVKVTRILWNDKFCFSLTFEEVTSKYLTKALQLADEQKEKVIATLTHELRTPINGIMGLLEISTSLIKDKVVQEYLKHCKSCANLLLHLVNSTLDLSEARQNNLQLEKTNFYIKEVLKELKSLFAFHSQQKGLKFEIERGPGVPTKIYTDKKRLVGVLVNLLSNAFKFTFRGSVKLSIAIDENNTDMLKFSVIDTGIGIKEQEKCKLFAMFGKIDENNKDLNSSGAGLGLSIANTLVKVLNHSDIEAQIQIQSEYNRGSVFSFSIYYINPDLSTSLLVENPTEGNKDPVDEEELQEIGFNEHNVDHRFRKFSSGVMPSPRFAINHSTSIGDAILEFPPKSEDSKLLSSTRGKYCNKQVLVVDDNPFNLMTASFLLGKLGFIVTCAKSGEECLELLESSVTSTKHYDLILMDIQMPVLSGVETTRIIKRRILENKLYKVLIIALTANPRTKKALDEYKESGMVDSLDKPLKEEDIHSIMHTYFSL